MAPSVGSAPSSSRGRAGHIRITAAPVWIDNVVPRAAARFRDACPGVDLNLDAASRAEVLRGLALGERELHCSDDRDERLPDAVRRERFPGEDLTRCTWGDFDARATPAPRSPLSSKASAKPPTRLL